MPTAKVNGVEVEFEPGMTVLQVAERGAILRDAGWGPLFRMRFFVFQTGTRLILRV